MKQTEKLVPPEPGMIHMPTEIKRTKEVQLTDSHLFPKPHQLEGEFPLLEPWQAFVNRAAEYDNPCTPSELMNLVLYVLRKRKVYMSFGGEMLKDVIHRSYSDTSSPFRCWLEHTVLSGFGIALNVWLYDNGLTHVRWHYNVNTMVRTIFDTRPEPGEEVRLDYCGEQFIKEAFELYQHLKHYRMLTLSTKLIAHIPTF